MCNDERRLNLVTFPIKLIEGYRYRPLTAQELSDLHDALMQAKHVQVGATTGEAIIQDDDGLWIRDHGYN